MAMRNKAIIMSDIFEERNGCKEQGEPGRAGEEEQCSHHSEEALS